MNRKLTITSEKDKLVLEELTSAHAGTGGGEAGQSLTEDLALANSATRILEAAELRKRTQNTGKPS